MYEPHQFADRIIRDALSDPQNLHELLLLVLGDVAERFDYDTVQYDQVEGKMADLLRRFPDLLCRLSFRTRDGDIETGVSLLIEHQSGPDHSIPLRMLEYGACYWRWLWDRGPKNKTATIPALIPIVFYTGARPWATKRDLGDLIQSPTCPLAVAPVWPILFLRLAEHSAEELLRSTKAWHQALAVVRAEREKTLPVFRRVLQAAVRGIDTLLDSDESRHWRLMDFMMKWVSVRRSKEQHEPLFRAVMQSVRPQHRELIRTMSHKIQLTFEEASELRAEERYQQGKAEGNAAGRADGELGTCRTNLECLLSKRFAAVPEDLLQRIRESMDIERLTACIEQVLDISSPAELEI